MGLVKYVYILWVIVCGLSWQAVYADRQDSAAVLEKELQEVNVVGRRSDNAVRGGMSGSLSLDISKLGGLPRFLGSADLVRALQLMPGVQTGGELNSGIYIRGGDPAHNSILLNGATVYNAMHLLGFFSLFNSDHYTGATLYKSYISPEHGGRLASVLEVSSRDSIARRTALQGSVGLISSQATLTLPTGDFGTVYLSGRTSYLRPILKLLQDDEMGVLYDFSDLNLTYAARPMRNARLIVNAYFGNDRAEINEYMYQIKSKIRWNNGAASARWQQSLPGGGKIDATAHFSWYSSRISLDQSDVNMLFPSEIKDTGVKLKYTTHFAGRSTLQAGMDYVFHHISPQVPDAVEMFGDKRHTEQLPYKTHEMAVYVACRTPWNQHIMTDIGLRYSCLLHTGEFIDRRYDDLGATVAETYYPGGVHKYYGSVEPRVGFAWIPQTDQRVRLSYVATAQYVNQVMTSGIGFPTDYWVPASCNIKPQRAHSVTAGYFRSIGRGEYEVSVEGYYRLMTDLLEYDGELFDMINRQYDVESGLMAGDGDAYGVEFMLQKNTGRLTGWAAYTLGWNNRRFPHIEQGRRFPAKYDRRHDFTIAANYRINDRWDVGATFVYATGCAFTLPERFYIVGENLINQYGRHNGARMPAYHRLDLSANWWLCREPGKESGLNFSIYNAYARNNPIFVAIKMEPNEEKTKISIRSRNISLYHIIPSISYFFKF